MWLFLYYSKLFHSLIQLCLGGGSAQDISGKQDAWNYYMEIFELISTTQMVSQYMQSSCVSKSFNDLELFKNRIFVYVDYFWFFSFEHFNVIVMTSHWPNCYRRFVDWESLALLHHAGDFGFFYVIKLSS